jgi:N-acetylglucosamine-6-phosphate deacetylase
MFGLRGNIIFGDTILENWVLVVEDDHIYDINTEIDTIPIEIFENCYIIPGFVDIHTHGAVGVDVMDADPQGILKMAEFLVTHGVTSFLPTTTTLDIESTIKAIKAIEEARTINKNGAKIIGVHLEGPFINPKYKGAQNEQFIIEPTREVLEKLIREDIIRLVTIAPELPGAEEAIKILKERGINVSMGHSDASYDDSIKGMISGATQVTHLFNGMRPFHHREPGIIGAALAEDTIKCQLIADGIHLHFGTIRMVFRAKGYKNIILISDSMSATGLSDGNYELGGLKVSVRSGAPRLPDGKLAGSTLTLDIAVKNIVTKAHVPLPIVSKTASKIPAESINEFDIGEFSYGKKADIVVIDKSFKVIRTYVDGRAIYEA